ncbi:Acetone carboxylase alpha subunit [Bhargavaea cecembensis DSE10]|uniref:Acetone carboxylase alpha subunit n=1 Tax=Bhargavaea cecembensis DSE10 TaxID=1235279 RepID=M7NH65_9BACL|nr:hydantoinase B/oxoprolinase family protein [Bhargavaea cecembensis]EMR06592.1 Acetone carboxylase alpha subunit [Bhargavaea cecembensis DSE10]
MDQILVSVISNRLKSICSQMGVTIEKSAHSPLLVEGRDFSLGLYAADGTLIEQTEYIPILGYATVPGVKAIVEFFEDDVHPGDVFLHNDTYTGGNQNSDWKVVKPVFSDGELVAWTAIIGHQADVGGAVPGSYNPHATDLWQEGLRIPPLKIIERGKKRRDVWDLVFGNVRLPIVADDITAMIGGCAVGEREFLKLVDHYDIGTINHAVEEIFKSTERIAKKIIRDIPNGTYRSSIMTYDDGFDHEKEMNIDVAIHVTDEHMTFDFTGTHEQTKGYVNAPLPVTVSSVMIGFFMLSDQDFPHNDAIHNCIDIIVPEGTMLNPKFPAASGFGNHLSDQIVTVVMMALSEVLPERVTAGWNPQLGAIINGVDPETDEQFVDILLNGAKGGSGGTHEANGFDHIGLIASGGALAAQDPEMFEITLPLFLKKYEYATDSAGAGQWRGGFGVETVFEINSPGAQLSVFGDGESPNSVAKGLLGGTDGAANLIELEYPNGEQYRSKMKDLISDIPKGTIYRQIAGGGGGYGDPKKRPKELILKEVKQGLISPEFALKHYGVETRGLLV